MKTNRVALLSLAVVTGLSLSLGALLALRGCEPDTSKSAESIAHQARGSDELPTLWPAPPFSYVDQHGTAVTLESLKGRVWVANFIFTQCRTICPLLTSKMVQLQRLLNEPDVRFVSFSVDPAHDTPKALATYAQKWNATEQRWALLSTDEKTLPQTSAGFRVTATPSPGGVDPIMHSTVFVLVDAKGIVRGAFSGDDRANFEALIHSAKLLLGTQANPAPKLQGDAEALYRQLSCPACHDHPELAPVLGGRAGNREELTTGALVTYDEAYVRESLLNPQAKMVRGYTLLMPSYDGLLDAQQLATLTHYVFSLPAPKAPSTEEEAFVAVDPVCQMQVRVAADTPRAQVDGGAVYFCSSSCKDRFLARPGGSSPR